MTPATKPGQWNDASWLFQVIQGVADYAQLQLQRGDLREARASLDRVKRNLTELDKLLNPAQTPVQVDRQGVLQTQGTTNPA